MKLLFTVLVIVCVFYSNLILAQDSADVATKDDIEEVKGAMEGINESMLEMKSTLDALKKIKFSGYIQVQYQNAETEGIPSFSGGNFPAASKSRFLVRRGRIKATYDNTISQYVIQVDITQSGVGIKDAYASFREPWLNSFGIKGGVFDRPFGFEISYSSSSRETPERSRLFQTLFPGERDLGAQIEFSREDGPLSFLSLKAGIFNGTGPTSAENDNNKDFIGRAGFQFPFTDINLAIDGGVSFYTGKVRSITKYIYSFNDAVQGMTVDSVSSNVGKSFDRNYTGADLQLYYDLPVLGGLSLRGEYITGKQPATESASTFYNSTDAKAPLYVRNVNGYYLNYVQNIGLVNQFVVKYDVFDPNTDVEGNDVGIRSKLSAADLKYSTLGIGWIHHWDANVKLVLYYDIVKNEKVNSSAGDAKLAPYKNDIKDNVFTFRIQYKF